MEHEHHHQSKPGYSEVKVQADYHDGHIIIRVRDDKGEGVELEDTHEKKMHLIVVSNDLQTFLHVHPIEKEASLFEVWVELEPGGYFAFVDINPKAKSYSIEPLLITVGSGSSRHIHGMNKLLEDVKLTKVVNGKKATLSHTELNSGEPVSLSFNLNGETPLPYLGALGHVVVIDEQIEKFIHVHPLSDDVTDFKAHFPVPGAYKLWAEFNFADQGVIAFPYVLEVN
ncbi:hypothetical protein [Virgibacillus dakarensis]|uniref:hypothetical protein n=1 Tax=Virgibacillus dakarensis TaxID=1917889 RepID=UPI000B44B553|nr:hypothetical protein [Virgibacillus dakarensis]